MASAIFFASSTGNTEEIANDISSALNQIETYNICDTSISEVNNYDKVIFGISTWGEGDLQDDWEDIWDEFKELDFTNKTVALFGLGDQDSYGDEFVDALGIMYDSLKEKGANIIGFTSIDGYEFDESKAQRGDEFVGLVIDEDNQDDLSAQRVKEWTEKIKLEIL